MAGPAYYPLANHSVQWFGDDYPGTAFDRVEKVVIHSTETATWPSYDGGAVAPHFTVRADFEARKLVWRQHFSILRNSRALRNEPGGVQTNLDGAVQVEIVGTCNRAYSNTVRHITTWSMPGWVEDGLALFLRFMHEEHGVPLKAPAYWPAFPPSNAEDARARMSGSEWNAFRGVCGHIHVPENTHGDPGDLPIATLLRKAEPRMTEEELNQIKAACVEALRQNIAVNENGADPTKETLSVADFVRMGDTKLDAAIGALRNIASAQSALAARLAAIELALSGVDLTALQAGMEEASRNVIERFIGRMTGLDIQVIERP